MCVEHPESHSAYSFPPYSDIAFKQMVYPVRMSSCDGRSAAFIYMSYLKAAQDRLAGIISPSVAPVSIPVLDALNCQLPPLAEPSAVYPSAVYMSHSLL
jgi:hypothetical protein